MRSRLLMYGLAALLFLTIPAHAAKIFIPMDADGQRNHLKAYGIAYAALQAHITVDWLLNYKGGSFCMDNVESMERLCKLRGVSYDIITDAQYTGIVEE